MKADPDIDVVQLKRAGYKEFCAGRDMQGLFLIALMSRTLTGYLEGNCKEIVAQRCSAKKAVMENSNKFTCNLLKRDSSTGVSQGFLQNFSEQLFYWTP